MREQSPRNPKGIIAQFNRIDHEHSHGWHRYPRAEFQLPDTVTIKHEVRIVRPDFRLTPIGCAMRHPDGRLVYITAGQYLSGGRLSNFWHWKEILPDGSLSETQESGYGW